MTRARGCDLLAVLAGALVCWLVVDGGGVAQESAEATEDLGNSYVLARRTTGQGSIIETLLFAGQPIVTEIAVPSRTDVDLTTGAAALAPARADNANAAGGDVAHAPLASGFDGTWLTGEVVDSYLVLHRIRATGPVMHEIFSEGHKVGSVTEVDSSGGARRSPGRNSFAFESTDDRFIVHLTQADGTRIRAITEHGRFSGQAIERVAAVAAPPRSAGTMPSSQGLREPIQPSIGRALESQRLARPEEGTGRIVVEEPRQRVPAPQEVVPLPREFPYPRLRPSITPVQTVSPSAPGNYRNTSAPSARPKPAVASAPAAVVPSATPKAAVASVPAVAAPRSVRLESTRAASSARSKSTDIVAQPPASAPAKPAVPTSKTGALAVKLKPAQAAANTGRSQTVAAKPATAGAKSARPVPSGTSSQ